MAGDGMADQQMADINQQPVIKRRAPLTAYPTMKKMREHEHLTPTSIQPAIQAIVDAYAQRAAAVICKINRLKQQQIKLETHKETNTFPRDIDTSVKCSIKTDAAISALTAAKADLLNSKITEIVTNITSEQSYADSLEKELRDSITNLIGDHNNLFPTIAGQILNDHTWTHSPIVKSFMKSREHFLLDYLAKRKSDDLRNQLNEAKKEEKRTKLKERQQTQATQADIDALKKQINQLTISGKAKRGGATASKKQNGGDSDSTKKQRARKQNKRAVKKRL